MRSMAVTAVFFTSFLIFIGCSGNSDTPGHEPLQDVYIPTDIPSIGNPDLGWGDQGADINLSERADQGWPDLPSGCPAEGSLIITEIMPNPVATTDKTGEYFELYNTTDQGIDLRNLEIQGNKPSEIHLITYDVPLIVPSHGYIVLGASDDKDLNGGINVDYVYDKINLGNTADRIAIYCGPNLIDQVKYNTMNGWPKKQGHAMVLDPSGYDSKKNDDPAYWCNSPDPMPNGDYGSPGAKGDACGASSCGDKVKQAWEQCDDGNDKSMDGCEPDCTLSPDRDNDGIPDGVDNCPDKTNPDQADADKDGIGDVCDSPDCGNNVKEGLEECDDGNQVKGDGCEPDCTISKDSDGDGVYDSVDNCPGKANPDQADLDQDGKGDVCDPPECGNNYREGDEQCDDGNTEDGDGCDHQCKKESFTAGEVVITELMITPKNVADKYGEYIEIYNPTDHPVNIRGWEIRGYSSKHRIKAEEPVVVVPKGYLVLARNGDKLSNGGFDADYVYSGISFSSDQDEVGLYWNGNLIDQVKYNLGHDGWPVAMSGHSLSLSPDHLDATANDDGANWCYTITTQLPEGDYGTPGKENEACQQAAAKCGNRIREDGEECDDGNEKDGDGCSASCRVEDFKAGQVIFTEVMINPTAVDDGKGEYIELYNTTDTDININGWMVRGAGDKSFVIKNDAPLNVPAKGFVVLGAGDGDYAANGGVHVDYAYGSFFSLVNSSENNLSLIWNGKSIDRVTLNLSNFGDTNATAGHSLSLDPSAFTATANDQTTNWCLTRDDHKLPGGDWGTPGNMNPSCSQ